MRPLAAACLALALAASVHAQQPGRGPRPGGPPGREEGTRLRIPSDACGQTGIAALVTFPKTPRWPEGAPVVIHIPGGWGQSGLDQRGSGMAGFGFVDVRFSFPGGGLPDFSSGGANDNRGEASLRALRDLIRWAMGGRPDAEGKTIQERAGGTCKVLPDRVGLAGWSNGGNPAGLVMALHGQDMPGLAFYVSYESPLGEGAAGAELGGFGTGPNPAYDPDTGVLDLTKLAWDPDLQAGSPKARGPRAGAGGKGPQAPAGGFFFDLDGDGSYTEGTDFASRPLVTPVGGSRELPEIRTYYSMRVLRAAEERGWFAKGRPSTIPTLAEAEAWWRCHDALPLLPQAVKNCPKVAVIVYGSEQDHVQSALDHPHILAQVEGYRAAGARFVRLNPDRAYVEAVTGGAAKKAADEPAGKAYDHRSIRAGLEPEDVTSDGGYMAAALCEVADRTHAGTWDANLDAVLFPDAPVGEVLPPRPPGRGR